MIRVQPSKRRDLRSIETHLGHVRKRFIMMAYEARTDRDYNSSYGAGGGGGGGGGGGHDGGFGRGRGKSKSNSWREVGDILVLPRMHTDQRHQER